MGASQSSQPPSRHPSRHGSDNKHKQKAASVSAPMKPSLPVIIDKPDTPATRIPEPQSVPAPSIAVPIPIRKPVSLPASGENSYVDQHKDTDLLHRLEELDLKDVEEEEMDEKEVQSKFGIVWVASDDFEEDDKNLGGTPT